MIVVGISGKIGTGKSTVAAMLSERLGDKCVVTSFAKKLKEEVAVEYGIDPKLFMNEEGKNTIIKCDDRFEPPLPKEEMTIREILQWYGSEYRRAQDEDYWVKNC